VLRWSLVAILVSIFGDPTKSLAPNETRVIVFTPTEEGWSTPQLKVINLDADDTHRTSYTAISYTWGGDIERRLPKIQDEDGQPYKVPLPNYIFTLTPRPLYEIKVLKIIK
jgi:hypothetical protein